MAGIRRDKLDSVFSDLVRGRAGWKSEYSGRTDGQLECCHIYGRAKRSVRWHPLNAVCLLHSEHRYFTSHPRLFDIWLESRMSPSGLHKLDMLAATPRKFSPREIEGLYQWYKAAREQMSEQRAMGWKDRIEFHWPDPIPEAQPRKRAKAKAKSKYKRTIRRGTVLREDAA